MIHQTILLLLSLAPGAPLEPQYGMGCILPTREEYQKHLSKGVSFEDFRKGMKVIPPESLELEWVPKPHPTGQGSTSSCVGWALGYAAKSTVEAAETKVRADTPDRYFSPTFIYGQRPDKTSEGMNVLDGVEILRSSGCATWAMMPFSEATVNEPPDARQRASAFPYQIAQYMFLFPINTESIKVVLVRGLPVVIAARVTPEFMSLQGDRVFRDFRSENVNGGHAMCVIGYDDRRGAFRLVNSWGTDWGDRGYGWVSYDLFDAEPSGDEQKFCGAGVALFDAPTVAVKTEVKTIRQSPREDAWAIWVEGSKEALGSLLAVEYKLPEGYEPRTVRRWMGGDEERPAVLNSSDVSPAASTKPIELQVRFLTPDSKDQPGPRTVVVPCGEAAVPPSDDSDDPPPNHDVDGPPVAVPEVVGLDSGIASLRLISRGLKVRAVKAPSDEAPRGTLPNQVLRQSPAAGKQVPKGSTVTLHVR